MNLSLSDIPTLITIATVGGGALGGLSVFMYNFFKARNKEFHIQEDEIEEKKQEEADVYKRLYLAKDLEIKELRMNIEEAMLRIHNLEEEVLKVKYDNAKLKAINKQLTPFNELYEKMKYEIDSIGDRLTNNSNTLAKQVINDILVGQKVTHEKLEILISKKTHKKTRH